ncbi:MAG TPA: neutral zinc metallopeptidase [Bryobacteraceae bacterium]|nr:neutral zinc metallopeptidase [Bryobacteraceae bacterium]
MRLTAVTAAVFTISFATAQAPPRTGNDDVQAVHRLIDEAQKDFVQTWTDFFRQIGLKFRPTNVIAFSGTIETPCKTLTPGNGTYCYLNNTIYLDSQFLIDNMKLASKVLHTDGDYAAVVIAAHEFGHQVAAQLNAASPWNNYRSETVADCFAGVVTREAKRKGKLDPGDLEEGLFSLNAAGDDYGEDVRQLKDAIRLVAAIEAIGQTHGFSNARKGAFLLGYYGGPGYCAPRFGPQKPPPSGPVLAAYPLTHPSPGVPSKQCRWTSGPRGMQVLATQENCVLNLLPDSAPQFPDHVRIEAAVTRHTNELARRPSQVGLYYGDARTTSKLTEFALLTNANPIAELWNIGRGYQVGGDSPDYLMLNWDQVKTPEFVLALDVHHIGKEVFFLELANGFPLGIERFAGDQASRLAQKDQAGLYLPEFGDEAVFRNLRLLALPD